MYKVVVFWRWDKGQQSADCFWCVPWPKLTNEEFLGACTVAETTHNLIDPDAPFDRNRIDLTTLERMGYPEAAKMLQQLPMAHLRARFNQLDMKVYNSEVPITREQTERIKLRERAA